MAKVNLSAPWITYYRKIEALFGEDPEIMVVYDEDTNGIKVYVDNTEKAEALQKLLPSERTFGNVTVTVTVIPANKLSRAKASLFETAFIGNPVFSFMKTVEGVFTNPICYVVFKNKVVQFWNDDLHDINGNCSTLYQEIAKDIFGEDEGICFCTDTE